MGGVRNEFRPLFGKVLTVAIGAVCAVALVWSLATDGLAALWEVAPWLGLLAGACWAVFWNPRVVVTDGGIDVINVVRSFAVPWPAVQAVDTKFALSLVTAYGTITAWAAPAPGARAAVRATRGDVRRIPDSAWAPDGVRPGDLPSTPSGSAALVIRSHWERLREAGHLDHAVLEHDRIPTRWHWRTIIAGAVLLAAAIVGLRF